MLAAGAVLVAMWRWPTAGLAAAILSLAFRPEVVFGGGERTFEWGVSHTLFALALVANGIRNGIRQSINWPVAGLILVFLLNLTLSDLHPRLTPALMASYLAVMVLPWTITQVMLAPGTRWLFALVIGLAPLLSIVIEILLALDGAEEIPFISVIVNIVQRAVDPTGGSAGYPLRLEGATGNAGAFAILAFAGMAASTREYVLRSDWRFGTLAIINFGLITLSGTRAALLASALLLSLYLLVDHDVRRLLRARRREAVIGGVVVGLCVLLYLPSLMVRLFGTSGELQLSGRSTVVIFYLEEFTFSPLFGRGIGAGFLAIADWVGWDHTTPHNDYLHFLVSGGIFGFVLLMGALGAWIRNLLREVTENDRRFLLAFLPAVGVYAMAWDVFIFPTGLAIFAYCGALLVRPLTRIRRKRRRPTAPPSQVRLGANEPAEARAFSRRPIEGKPTAQELGSLALGIRRRSATAGLSLSLP